MMEHSNMKEIVNPLLEWYDVHARKLPWRENPEPYHVWLSEIMLQQTRVEAVKGYYQRFLQRLPSVDQLAQVEEEELMKLWQGLGYYNRARNLKKAAEVICEEYEGRFPDTYEEWLKIPGIGEYTAGAVTSIAFDRRVPAVDGNVYRIYTRLRANDTDITQTSFKRKVREDIAAVLPENAGKFNQALMDLGATVCLPNGMPLCEQCPLSSFCRAWKEDTMLDYPVKPKKKKRRIEEKTILLIEYQGRYLIQKRPDKGLLAGLWEFPSQEGFITPEQLQNYLWENGTEQEKIQLLGRAKHIFSHVEWHMLGYEIRLKTLPENLEEQGIFGSVKELQDIYSIPSAFSCYMKYLTDRATE